jgi:hypothetical protein
MVQNIAPTPPSAVISIQPLTTPVSTQDTPSNALQGVPAGTLLEGFVVNRDQQQNPVLRTSVGDILVKSEFFLKTGSEIVIQVDASIASRARIISIDGLTPQDYASKNIALPAHDEILGSSLLAQARPVAANGPSEGPVLLSAVLLSPNILPIEGMPPEVAQYWSQIVASLKKDAAITVKLIATELPLPGDPAPAKAGQVTVPLQTPVPSATPPTPTSTTTQTPPPNVASQPTAPLPAPATPVVAPTAAVVTATAAPTPLQVTPPPPPPIAAPVTAPRAPASQTTEGAAKQPNAVPLPSTTPAQSPTASRIPTVTAQVIGHELDGANIVQTAVGTFKLLTAHPLPTGSKLTLEIQPKPTTPPAQSVSQPLLPTDLEEFTTLARDWSSLRDAISTIASYDPQIANQLINDVLPKAHGKLANDMLFLFAAIKTGSLEQWIGKRAIDVLDLRSPEVLKRLTRDFAQLQQVFSDALPQWMSVVVPFYSGAQLEHVRMYFRQDDEGGQKKDEGGGQRFVIEIDLSHLGDMQLDGFVKKSANGQYFDLVVRSVRHLPNDVQQGIRQIFEQSLQVTGYKGYVNFQQGSQHFVRPLESVKAALNAGTNTILA